MEEYKKVTWPKVQTLIIMNTLISIISIFSTIFKGV
jgi:preprotein translocase subunit SecE